MQPVTFTVNFPIKYVAPFINAVNKGNLESTHSRMALGIVTSTYKWLNCTWCMTVSQTHITCIELLSGKIDDELLLIEYIKNRK